MAEQEGKCLCLHCQIGRAIHAHKTEPGYYDFLHAYLDLEDWQYRTGCDCDRCVAEYRRQVAAFLQEREEDDA